MTFGGCNRQKDELKQHFVAGVFNLTRVYSYMCKQAWMGIKVYQDRFHKSLSMKTLLVYVTFSSRFGGSSNN